MVTISQTLEAALTFHRAGDLDAAERLYRKILAHDERHADAWHLLGLVAYARGGYTEALEAIGRAIALDPRQPSFHNHLAEAHRALGQLDEAAAASRQALRLRPDFAIAHNTLGTVLDAQGLAEQAIASYRQAIAAQPDFAQAHYNLGLALEKRGRLEQAIASYRQAVASKRDYALAYQRLAAALRARRSVDEAIDVCRQALVIDAGNAAAHRQLAELLHARKHDDEAICHFNEAVRLAPADAVAHLGLGNSLVAVQRTDEALECFRRAAGLDPSLAEAHFNQGAIYQDRDQLDAAAECYRQAIRANPRSAESYNSLGTVYRLRGQLSEAIEAYQRALEYRPDFVEVLSNLGNVFQVQGRRVESMICYDQTLRLRPDHAATHTNRAMSRLAEGDYAAGFVEYEWRWKCEKFPRPSVDVPQWDGCALGDRVLLVHAEQGLGDTLQFVRYLPLVAARAGCLVVEVQGPLLPLLERLGFHGLLAKGAALPPVDVQIAMMSLPRIFGTTLETIPAGVPYLCADPALVAQWGEKLAATAGFKVGIAWQGSKSYQADRFRSIPLAEFAPLAQPGVELVSLQKGTGVEQLPEVASQFAVRNLGDALDGEHGPFMDTAAIMKCLDLVITSDTVTAHLAGGLGVPVWVALPFAPDWRWHREGDDSPWYPTMRLFRQTQMNDWPSVFARMAEALRCQIESRKRHKPARDQKS